MAELTPNDIKALILLGIFHGDAPRGHNEYRSLEVSREAIYRMGNLDDIVIEIVDKPETMSARLTVYCDKTKSDPFAIGVRAIAEAEHNHRKAIEREY